jgi:hypothetical protein
MVKLVGRTGGTPVTVVVAVVDVEVEVGVLLTRVLVDDVKVATGVLTVVLTVDVLGTITTGTEEVLIRVEEGVTITVEFKTPLLHQYPFGISEL